MIILRATSALESLSDADLDGYWLDLAVFLQGKLDRKTRKLPKRYESAYADLVAEFKRRGVQLELF